MYGTSPGSLGSTLAVPGATSTNAVVNGLTAGTWYFAVVVVNANGTTSAPSAAVARTLP